MSGIGSENVEFGDDLGGKWNRLDLSGEVVNDELFISRAESISNGQFNSSISNNAWVLHFSQIFETTFEPKVILSKPRPGILYRYSWRNEKCGLCPVLDNRKMVAQRDLLWLCGMTRGR